MNRREFLKSSSSLLLGASLPLKAQEIMLKSQFPDWFNGTLPLYCLAYVNPGIESHKNQERNVAKYPLAIVSQDNRYYFKEWRDRVRNINPNIKMLAYQIVIEESTNPGPGHDEIRKIKNSWATYPDGYLPRSSYKNFRIFDPRKSEWKERFLEACERTLKSYPFSGLFLDQCTIYPHASLVPSEREEMLQSVREAVKSVRRMFPKKIIVCNSSYSFDGANGEMNENRPKDLSNEVNDGIIHEKPVYNLFHHYIKNNNLDDAKEALKMALKNKSFFGCCKIGYDVNWYPFFYRTIGEYLAENQG